MAARQAVSNGDDDCGTVAIAAAQEAAAGCDGATARATLPRSRWVNMICWEYILSGQCVNTGRGKVENYYGALQFLRTVKFLPLDGLQLCPPQCEQLCIFDY